MTAFNIDLPPASVFNFHRTNETGEKVCVLSGELVYLDQLLTSAQKTSTKSKSNPDDRFWWLEAFTRLVNDKYRCNLTQTEAHTIALAISTRAGDLKKNLVLMQKSLQPTGSIPSNSPENNSKGSTSTSAEPKPSENSLPE